MNLVGKIITILILLLSVGFLMVGVMVNASHQNWKQMAMDNKALVESTAREKQVILEQTQEKDLIIETEKVARMLRLQQLESQLTLAKDDRDDANADLAAQRVKASQNMIQANEAEERLAQQDGLITSLQEQLRTATVDLAQQREKVVAMTTQIFELEGRKRELEAMKADLQAETTLARKVMTANGLALTDLTSHISPELDGLVTYVMEENISLNLGLDDGLLKGHSVDIHRDGRYVGTARVFRAENNRAAARMVPGLSSIQVQVGDNVTTKWVRDQ
ncbi:MAG: hypothetical protein ACR2NP_16585 [Pirellulaceae bacterium]